MDRMVNPRGGLVAPRRWLGCVLMCVGLLAACGDEEEPKQAVPCNGPCPIGQVCDAARNVCAPPVDPNNTNNTNNDTNNPTNNPNNNPTNNPNNNDPDARACERDTDCALGSYCEITSETISNCLPGCRGDDSCASSELCDPETRRCEAVDGFCDDDGIGDACPAGATCCPRGSYCDLEASRCVEGCTEDAQCRFGLPCIEAANKCGCDTAAECGDNFACEDQLCIPVACSPDALEPNNDALTARRLAPIFGAAQMVEGLKFCPSDQDYFAMWLLPGVTVEGQLARGEGGGEVRWTWRSPSDRRVDNGSNVQSWEFTTEESGLYTLQLDYRDAAQQLTYTLSYTLSDDGVMCDVDGSPSGTFRMGLQDTLAVGPVSMCADQSDTFQLEMERPGQELSLQLTRTDQLPQTEVTVEILDADGAVLASSVGAEFSLSTEAVVVPSNPRVRVRVTDGGTPLGVSYRLALTSNRGMSDEICVDDANEDNDSRAAATPVVPGEITGQKACAEDLGGDWLSFEAAGGASVSLDVVYEGEEVPTVRLHLPDGRALLGVTTVCGAGQPCVRFSRLSSAQAGSWFIEVVSTQANVDYDLLLGVAVACDPAPGAWVSGCECAPDLRDAPYAAEPGSIPLGLPANTNGAPSRVFLGTLCSGDTLDSFPFWTPPGAGMAVQATRTGGQGTATVTLRDASGAAVATGALDAPLMAPAGPGFRRWTLEVRASGQGSLGYELGAALVTTGAQSSCIDDSLESSERDRRFDLGPSYGRWTLVEPGAICINDTDRFRLTTLQAGDGLTLTLRNLWALERRVKLRLLNAEGALMGEAEDLGGVATLNLEGLPIDVYTVEIDGILPSPASGIGYRLEAELRRPAGACVNEASEPNGTAATAGALSEGWTYGGVLCRQTDDEDVYALEASAGERVMVRYVGAGPSVVSLTTPGGAEVPGASSMPCGGGLTCLEFGPVDVTPSTAGEYLLEIITDLALQSIPYRVEVTSAPICTGPAWSPGCVCLEDANSPSGTREEATRIPVSLTAQTVSGQTLCGEGEDWFRFEGSAQGRRLRVGFAQTRPDEVLLVQLYGGVLGNTLLEEFVAAEDLTIDNPTFADLWVRVVHGGSGVGYSFTYRFEAVPSCGNDLAEPNDDPNDDLMLVSGFESIGNTGAAAFELNRLCGPSDEDWFRVEFQGFEDDMVVLIDRYQATQELRDMFPIFDDYVDAGIDEQAIEVEIFDASFRSIGRMSSAEMTWEFRLTGLDFGEYWARVRIAQPVVGGLPAALPAGAAAPAGLGSELRGRSAGGQRSAAGRSAADVLREQRHAPGEQPGVLRRRLRHERLVHGGAGGRGALPAGGGRGEPGRGDGAAGGARSGGLHRGARADALQHLRALPAAGARH